MTVQELVSKLNLTVKTRGTDLNKEVKGGYASDLLSDVMANCSEGFVWVTLQIHQNIVAVASMKDVSAILLVNNREPDEGTLKKAAEEKITILVSKLPAFELAGRLYNLGIKGKIK